MDSLNLAGAVLFTATAVIVSVYLVSTFTLAKLGEWFAGPLAWIERRREAFYAWRERLHQKSLEKAEEREVKRRAKAQAAAAKTAELEAKTLAKAEARAAKAETKRIRTKAATVDQAAAAADTPPWETAHDATPADAEAEDPEYASIHEIPICPIEDLPPEPAPALVPDHRPAPAPTERKPMMFEMPSTELLNEIPGRSAYDEQELKDTAVRIKSKFEEFNVLRLGGADQSRARWSPPSNSSPKPASSTARITTLTEDLCLGLQAESILIERIPGKPTVGIEVPEHQARSDQPARRFWNRRNSTNRASPLTIALGKDINGRIKVAALDSMPHLLIAGSTGSGKSVMINSLIMSILYKATPRRGAHDHGGSQAPGIRASTKAFRTC